MYYITHDWVQLMLSESLYASEGNMNYEIYGTIVVIIV